MARELLLPLICEAKQRSFRKWSSYFIERYQVAAPLLRTQLDSFPIPTENELQSIVDDTPELLLHGLMDGYYGVASTRSCLYPKFPLGSQFQTDYLFCNSSSRGIGCTFVELERSDSPLFSKNGDPSKYLTHAIRQVNDWATWLDNNRAYAEASIRQALAESPQFEWPDTFFRKPFQFVVVIGRRSMLSRETNMRRNQICGSQSGLNIITWDRLCDDYMFDKAEPLKADDARVAREFAPDDL